MKIPPEFVRYPTSCAIASLATRFGLPYEDYMQDWEYEVATPEGLHEFLRAFFTAELTQDERFLLAEMLMQSFNDSDLELDTDPLWKSFLERIELNIGLHICTLVYWSTFGTPLEDSFRVSASLRDFLSRTDLTFMGKS